MQRKYLIIIAALVFFLVGLPAAAWGGCYFYVKAQIDAAILSLQGNPELPVVVTYEHLWVNPIRSEISLSGIRAEVSKPLVAAVTIASAKIKKCGAFDSVARSCSLSVVEMKADSPNPQLKKTIADLEKTIGVPLSLNIDSQYNYEPENDFLIAFTTVFKLNGAGQVAVTEKLSGIDPKEGRKSFMDLRQTKGAAVASIAALAPALTPYMKAKIHRLEVTYTDSGLAPKIMGKIAAEQGISVAQLKSQILQLASASVGGKKPRKGGDPLLSALRKFLEKPKEFGIAMQPPKPITIQTMLTQSQIQGPGALAVFGVAISLNNKKISLADVLKRTMQLQKAH